MLKHARKIARGNLRYGVLLTIAITAAAGGGLLDNLDRWFYDKRCALCQFFTPPPTDKLVHIDIDDSVLDAIGAWPWHRALLAQMMDELQRAGPKVVATDVLFSEPQDIRFLPGDGGGFDAINDDQLLAQSIQGLGCAIVGMSMSIQPAQVLTPVESAMRDALRADLELSQSELIARLGPLNLVTPAALEVQVSRGFIEARREAMYRRVYAELLAQPRTAAQLRTALLKRTDADTMSPVVRLLDEQYEHVSAELSLQRFERPVPPGLPPLFTSDWTLPPIPILAKAAAGTAFFDYPTEKDGKVRRVPLFMEHDGQMVPQIGLSMAVMMLGAKIEDLKITPDSVTIPRTDGPPVVLPVYTLYSDTLKQSIPMMFDIPWFGTSDWQTMYDKVGGAHLSMNVLWDICQTREKIISNNRQADDALKTLYAAFAPEKLDALVAHAPPLDDPKARAGAIAAALSEYGPFIDAAQHPDPSVPFKDEKERQDNAFVAAAGPALQHALDENPRLGEQLITQRAMLRQHVHDKGVLIGWAATANVADMVPTSLHPKCPGAVIHGTIFNAIMTGRSWTRVSPWVNGGLTVFFGLLTALVASRTSPTRACAYALLIAVFYTVINGLLLFDYLDMIVTLAGPLVAIGLVWAGCTLTRLLSETMERARITRRFRSYVDPTLVNYLVDHPDNVRLHGEVRELTVCFTDLQSFTKITEQLGEQAVPLLNEFMGIAIPIIRNHGGYVNKFLGDGIMFFFGAPKHVPDHAARAFNTVLALKAAMVELNRSLQARGLPHLSLRAGVSTGQMVVGDAGTIDASDYTVLGDCVNLGARLESANKAIGSHNLANQRAVELAGAGFLVRPVGNFRYMGKQTGVVTYEVLSRAESADDQQRAMAEMSRAIVEAYSAGDLSRCLAAIEQMETALGPNKLTALYREHCEKQINQPSASGFDGLIVLGEK
jgi:class 3 adenylate cyclase/CHASE2 domain-containing sensor protein